MDTNNTMMKRVFRPRGIRITVITTGVFLTILVCTALYIVKMPLFMFLMEYPSRRCNKCNQHNFTFEDTAQTKCGDSDVFLLTLVISHPNYTTARNSIRDTWGSVKKHGLHNFKTIFVLGKTGIKTIDDEVKKESRIHNDIVVTNIQESYFKLTEKVLASLSWSLQNCKQFKYILKTDDDSYNNPRLFVDFIASVGYPSDLVSGRCEIQVTGRAKNGKWYLTEEEYPGYYLPFFCKGPAYVLAHKTAEAFYQLSSSIVYFKLEDVFLTGFVREEYGLEPVQIPNIYANPSYLRLCYAREVTSVHHAESEDMVTIWNWITTPANRPYDCTYLFDRLYRLPVVIFICVILLFFLIIRKFCICQIYTNLLLLPIKVK